MKQFRTILGFELKNFYKNRIFVGLTLFICAVICFVMFFPRISAAFVSSEDGDEAGAKSVMLVCAEDEAQREAIAEAFGAVFADYDVKPSAEPPEAIREAIRRKDAKCAFIFDSLTSFTYLVDNLSLYDQNEMIAAEALLGVFRMSAVTAEGVSPDRAAQIFEVAIEHTAESIGVDQTENFFYTYIMIFALYMVILLYGQMIATNVATEKSSRAMELLITSTKPTSMMFGKVIAACLAGLTQLVCIFGSALLFYDLNREFWSDNMIVSSIFDIPPVLLCYMLLFFVLGFAVYAFMYGAVGSTVSKLEDVNTAVMPVTLVFIVGFFVVVQAMTSGETDSALIRVCSFVPFTSPMAMFTRIALSTVPAWEIALSVGVLAASAIAIGVLAARIYRVGVLMYGNRPKLGALIRSVLGGAK